MTRPLLLQLAVLLAAMPAFAATGKQIGQQSALFSLKEIEYILGKKAKGGKKASKGE